MRQPVRSSCFRTCGQTWDSKGCRRATSRYGGARPHPDTVVRDRGSTVRADQALTLRRGGPLASHVPRRRHLQRGTRELTSGARLPLPQFAGTARNGTIPSRALQDQLETYVLTAYPQGMSLTEVAQLVDRSETVVRRILIAYQVPRRRPGRPRTRQ